MSNEEEALWRGFEARLERVEEIVRELDEIIRGDRHRKIIGLIAEQDRMDAELRKLNAVVFVDSTGKRGLAHDVDLLMDRRSGNDRRAQFHWEFWTAVTVAVISSVTALVTNWDHLKKMFPTLPPGVLEAKIERARHPKSPKKIYRVRHVPADSEEASPDPS